MKFTSYTNRLALTGFLLAASLMVFTTVASGAPASEGVASLDLRKEPALQVKVSFEARHQAVKDLLMTLRRQSGVTLLADAASIAARKQITARVRALPLAGQTHCSKSTQDTQ